MLAQKSAGMMRGLLNQAGLRQERKVFAIGFNKSASSSLHALFQSLGLPSYHGVKWRKHDNPRFLRKYDCFSDDIPRDLAELDRSWPDSKFILNVRELEGWIYSRLAHIERVDKSKRNFQPDPHWDTTEEAIKGWIRKRNDYHQFVLSYFVDRPADLLVVNFLKDHLAATKICQFLGYEIEIHRPHRNINPSKKRPQEHTEMLRNAVAELGVAEHELAYDLYCPSLENGGKESQFSPDSSTLESA
jgi:hypothetical protein